MTTITKAQWTVMPQAETRTRIREMLNNGLIKLVNITESDFRELVNGSTLPDGISLGTFKLREVGMTCEYVHPTPEPIAATIAEPSPEPAASDSDDALNAALQSLQAAVAARSRPAIDPQQVQRIAYDTMETHFDGMFADRVKSSSGALDQVISGAVTKFATDEIASTVSVLVQGEFGQSIRTGLADGSATMLPPIRPVSPAFCENSFTKRLAVLIALRAHIISSGPSGAGKTFPIENVLNRLGKRWIKIGCADGISMSELLAEKVIEVENGVPTMKVILKALPICMREGLILIMDEIDKLPDEILSVLYAATDKYPGEIYIPQSGERITAHPDFQIIATCNGLTDESGLYSGHQISGALKTRFVSCPAEYLTKSEEVEILERDGLTRSAASDLVDVFTKLRTAHDSGVLTMPPSTRTMLLMSKLMQGKDTYGNVVPGQQLVTQSEALDVAVMGMLCKSERDSVTAILNA